MADELYMVCVQEDAEDSYRSIIRRPPFRGRGVEIDSGLPLPTEGLAADDLVRRIRFHLTLQQVGPAIIVLTGREERYPNDPDGIEAACTEILRLYAELRGSDRGTESRTQLTGVGVRVYERWCEIGVTRIILAGPRLEDVDLTIDQVNHYS